MGDQIVVYTDGSCYPNDGTGDGGWAFQCSYKGKSVVKYGWSPCSSNNAMELTAIFRALQYIPEGEQTVNILTDSTYCKNVITKWAIGWELYGWTTATGLPVRNKEIIAPMMTLIEKHSNKRIVNVQWIKGHSGIDNNEIVDGAAGNARKQRLTNWVQQHNKHQSERILHRKRLEDGHSSRD